MRPIDIAGRPIRDVVAPGAPPMLQWVRIADLVVDDRYQRELNRSNWKAIERIADGFSWSKFSPVFCAPVAGGKFAIIDGQHRTHAAALCGFAELPAQIVQMSEAEQASSFAAVNGDTIRITPFHIYRAALEAGEPDALAARDAVAAAGCTLMTHYRNITDRAAGEIYSFRAIRAAIADGHAAVLTKALTALRRSETGDTADAWSDALLRGWIGAVLERQRIGIDDLVAFLDQHADLYEIEDRVERFIRDRRRLGHPSVQKFDLLAIEIGSAIDKAFPVRLRATETA